MCDYCGCRDRPAIAELSAEHDELLELIYGLRRLADAGERAGVRALLEQRVLPLLRAHVDKEERGLFTQLRSAWAADARLDALVDEHRDLDERIAGLIESPSWRAELREAARLLADHIMAEEVDLFPYALYELGAGQWEAVDAVHAAHAAAETHAAPDAHTDADAHAEHHEPVATTTS
jgi:hemerythrin-like domain-containing protein